MGAACSCFNAPDREDPPQHDKVTLPPSPDATPLARAAPPEAVSRTEVVVPADEQHSVPLPLEEAVPELAAPRPAAAEAVVPAAAAERKVPDSGPCDFPVLVLPRMQRPGQQQHKRSPSAGEGYDADPHHSATSSLQQSGGDGGDAAAGAGKAPHAVMDDLVSALISCDGATIVALLVPAVTKHDRFCHSMGAALGTLQQSHSALGLLPAKWYARRRPDCWTLSCRM